MDKEPIQACRRGNPTRATATKLLPASGGAQRSTTPLPAAQANMYMEATMGAALCLLLLIIGSQQVLAAPESSHRAARSSLPGWPDLAPLKQPAAQPLLKFQIEPPALVEYSNTTGAVILCRPYTPRTPATAPASTATTPEQQQHLLHKPIGAKLTKAYQDTPVSVNWRLIRQVPGSKTSFEEQQYTEEPIKPAPTSRGHTGPRYVRPDGALVLSPFAADDYRPDIHAATYRCCLSNRRSQLCSNPVRARPVIDSTLILEVFDEFALAGNSALLKCQPTPAHLAVYLKVVSWFRNDRLLVSADNGLSQRIDSSSGGKAATQSSKYLMLNTGELLIANASQSDAALYKCRARHRLTGQLLASRIGGRLMVENSRVGQELKSSAQAREQALQVAREHSDVFICARTQSQPVARHVWYMETSGLNREGNRHRIGDGLGLDLNEVRQINQEGDCIHISQARADLHSGLYTCEADNGSSQLRVSTRLLVLPSHLSVQLQLSIKSPTSTSSLGLSSSSMLHQQLAPTSNPQQRFVPSGTHIQLNCSILGGPFNTVAWFKDGSLIAVSNLNNGSVSSVVPKLKILHPTVISIANFEQDDRGLYQCQVYSVHPVQKASQLLRSRGVPEEDLQLLDGSAASQLGLLDEAQMSLSSNAALQIDLTSSAPNLVGKFSSQTLEAGSSVSLQCQASGAPPPRLFWFLDKQLIQGPSSSQQLFGSSSEEEQQQQQLLGAVNKLTAESDISGATQEDEAQVEQEQWLAEDLEWQKLMNSHYQPIKESRFQMSTWRAGVGASLATSTAAATATLPFSVTSQLNISRLSPAETGEYKCLAVNSLGSALQAAHINVIGGGGLHLRSYQALNVTLIAGRSASLQCPLVGYPIARVDWLHAGRRLPENHRQHVQAIRNGLGGQLELTNIDPVADTGLYTCRVQLQSNATTRQEHENDGAAHLHISIQVPPMIEAQSLPEVLQTNEGMRTKLLCSVVQGDHPIEIRWLKRADRYIKSPGRPLVLPGFELMQNMVAATEKMQDSGAGEDLVTIHNLEDSSLLTFRQIAYSDSGEYACIAQNQAGKTVRYTRIIVNIPPTWLLEPVLEMSVLLGSRLELECSAFGQPMPTVTWKRNLVKAVTMDQSTQQQTGASAQQDPGQLEYVELVSNYRNRAFFNGTLVIHEVELSDAGYFMCEISNGIGAGLSKITRVKVNVPPHFKQRAGSQFALIKTVAELKCTVLGNQPMTVTWSRAYMEDIIDSLKDPRHRFVTERSLSADVFESVLLLNKLSRNDSGQYICSASNEFGTEQTRLQLFVQEVPEAPVLLKPVRASSRQATLSFRAPFSGNSPIKRYEISYRQFLATENAQFQMLTQTNSSISWQQVSLDPSLESSFAPNQSDSLQLSEQSQLVNLNLCCLLPFTRYFARVRALNEVGWSEPSKSVQFITEEEPIGGPPLDVGVEATGAHSLKVRWRPPARHLQNGLIRGYYIGYRAYTSPSSLNSNLNGNPSILSSNVKVFESAESDQYQYKNVQLDLGLVTFQYGASLAADPSLINLQLYQNYSSSQQQQTLTSYLINLRRKTSYSVIVQAYNKLGASPRSDEVIVSTLDAAPPMSPLLRVLSVTHNSAMLTWSVRRFIYESQQHQSSMNESRFVGSRQQPSGLVQPNQMALDTSSLMNAADQSEYEDDDPQFYYTINFRAENWRSQARDISVAAAYNRQPSNIDTVNHLVSASNSNAATSAAAADDDSDDSWHQKRIPRRQALPFTLTGLRCGSHHEAFMTATNSLGQSEPGETIKFTTLGGAPVAPVDSRHFLQLNFTYAVVHLSAWHNAGCLISFFLIKYRASGNSKWTILEHQPQPQPQQQQQQSLQSAGQQMSLGSSSQHAYGASTAHQQATMQDFIIKNLDSDRVYRLVVEAHSEAGSTVAEYELEMANLTSSIISVHVNGLVASDAISVPSSAGGTSRDFNPEQGDDLDFGFIGGQRSPGAGGAPMLLRGYSMSAWSLTMLFVIISVLMIGSALVLALRGLMRTKPNNSNSGNGNNREAGLLSTLFCWHRSSGSYSSSNPDGSQSSGSAGTCYQVPTMDHCAIHDELKSMPGDYAGLPFRQLVNSSSLSTIEGPLVGPIAQPGAPRHTLTLGSAAHCQATRRLNGTNHYDMNGNYLPDLSPAAGAHLRAHYASTLGRQHSVLLKNSQPIKFNAAAAASVYGQLLTDNNNTSRSSNNNNKLNEDQQYSSNTTTTNNYQLCNGGPLQSASLALSSTSGTSSFQTNNSLKTDPASLQLPHCLQTIDASQVMQSYGSANGHGLPMADTGANLFSGQSSDPNLRPAYGGGSFEQEEPVLHNQGHQCLYNNGSFNKLELSHCLQLHHLQHQHDRLSSLPEQVPGVAYGMIYAGGPTAADHTSMRLSNGDNVDELAT